MMIRSAVLIQALCGLGCTPQVPGTSPHPDGTDDTEAPPLSDTGESVGSTSGATTPSPNYAVPGPYGFSTATGTHQTGGCQLAYTQFEPDELTHRITLRLTARLLRDDLTFSMFALGSPNERDLYIRPALDYRVSDAVGLALGANVMLGDQPHTFFGQLQDNSNAFMRLRYTF